MSIIMRPEVIQILSAGIAGLGFAIIFHIRPKHLPVTFVGASLGWLLYLAAKQVWRANAIGMIFAALMRGFVTDSQEDFVEYGSMLLEDTLSIVLGTMIVLTFVSAVAQKRKRTKENRR